MRNRTDSLAVGLRCWPKRQETRAGNRFTKLFFVFWFAVGLGIVPAVAADVPVVKGDLGPCSADFTVNDSAGKPLFDAKIQVTVVYGFMNKRKSEFEVGTNAEGKARIEGLPEKVKKLLEFRIRHRENSKSVIHDPAHDCHANFTVVLGAP
jgi:hypothetical protein